MSEEPIAQPQAEVHEEKKPKFTKEEKMEFQRKKNEERKAKKEARKAAKREEYEESTVEITHDEFIKFKQWKCSQAKIRVDKEQYQEFLEETAKAH